MTTRNVETRHLAHTAHDDGLDALAWLPADCPSVRVKRTKQLPCTAKFSKLGGTAQSQKQAQHEAP